MMANAADFLDAPDTKPAAKQSAAAFLDAGPAAAEPAPKFPRDDPGYTYGDILPLARNKATGSIGLAVPEMIRSPLRGVLDMSERLQGPLTPDKLKTLNPDELAAVTLLGGARVSPTSVIERTAARAAAREAHDAGYVLPPIEATKEPGATSKVLGAMSGKVKLQQAASDKNQEVTNRLAHRALGLPDDAVLSDQAFKDIRAEAGKAYGAIIKALPEINADKTYLDSVSELGGANSHAAREFPGITKNPAVLALVDELGSVKTFSTEAGIEVVKELRYNANLNLHARDDPSRHALGLAQREAASLIDDLIDRNIEKDGQIIDQAGTKLVDAYRAARRLIAKSYDVEAVTNMATGDVNALGLARLATKGKPFTDELRTIARTASAFPKDMQQPSRFGGVEPYSVFDFFGSAGAAAAGHPGLSLLDIGRAPARGAVLSRPFQRGMMGAPTLGGPTVPPAQAVPSLPYRWLAQPTLPGAAAAVGQQPEQ